MLLFQHIDQKNIELLLAKYQLNLVIVPDNHSIPGTFWGEPEAGLIGNTLYIRSDTPVHSLLHESCHYICMDDERRHALHTDAGGTAVEENAVCYLQILLSNHLSDMGSTIMMQNMDEWGYSFRLGSAGNWFKEDAEDAIEWLQQHQLIDTHKHVTFQLRH
jgi:hypothetical protein